jgi:hypothetical protein
VIPELEVIRSVRNTVRALSSGTVRSGDGSTRTVVSHAHDRQRRRYEALAAQLVEHDAETASLALAVAGEHPGHATSVELAGQLELTVLSDQADGGEDLYVGVIRRGRSDAWFVRAVRVPAILAALSPDVVSDGWEWDPPWPGGKKRFEIVRRTSRTDDAELAAIVGDGTTSLRHALHVVERRRDRQRRDARRRSAHVDQLLAQRRYAEETERAAAQKREEIERRGLEALQRSRTSAKHGDGDELPVALRSQPPWRGSNPGK